ncbi:MAG: hypothetical protein AAGM38_03250 [Pseudomonadota bacterium]
MKDQPAKRAKARLYRAPQTIRDLRLRAWTLAVTGPVEMSDRKARFRETISRDYLARL